MVKIKIRRSIALPVAVFLMASFFGSVAQEPKSVRIGILTDCQYGNFPDNGVRFYRLSLSKLDICKDTFNSLPLDAVFHLGDMIDHDYNSYDSVLPGFEHFKAPLSLIAGNHEYMIAKQFKPRLLDHLGIKEAYYRVDLGNWSLIILNGDDLSFLAPQTRVQKKERNELILDLYASLRFNGMLWNGGIGKKQMKWLADQLKEEQSLHRKVIILCHFPLFSREDHNLFNNVELFTLLVNYPCVKAYFCGHFHDGNYQERQGIHLVNFKGMVNTRENAFSVITLTNDSILVKGYGRESDRHLGIR